MTYQQRKDAHLQLAAENEVAAVNQFDDIAFVHHSLAGINRAQVRLDTTFAGLHCPYPLYINAMTGGSDNAGTINGQLAEAAAEIGIPIASGSMSAYLHDPPAGPTYSIMRTVNPKGIIAANVNANTEPDDARRAIDLLHADVLQIHLNSVQEIVMPEGDRSFGHWNENIAKMIASVDIPVIVKEVGFGISRESYATLTDLGAQAVDVSGTGGTNFAAIENHRRSKQDFDYLSGWGHSAAASLLEIQPAPHSPELLASGGVRNPLDVVKALALGARAVGTAGHLLRIVLHGGTSELVDTLRNWIDQITSLMTILGTPTIDSLRNTDLIITGSLAERATRRGIDLETWGNRPAAATLGDGNVH